MNRAFDLAAFERDGFYVIDEFLSEDEVRELKTACWDAVDNTSAKDAVVFSSGITQASTQYFMESSDKVRLFYEKNALDEFGNLVVPRHNAFNKIAHALHTKIPTFKSLTFSEKIVDIVKEIGYVDPIVFQSMCIFKPPFIGGEVCQHQDMTYLYVDSHKLLAFWIPLEDTDVHNSCLYFVPGSHKNGLINDHRFIKDKSQKFAMKLTGSQPDLDEHLFVAQPMKKGSLAVFDGCVVHKSAANKSDRSRLAYTFHLYDAHKGQFSEDNWIQPTAEGTFVNMYTGVPIVPNNTPN